MTSSLALCPRILLHDEYAGFPDIPVPLHPRGESFDGALRGVSQSNCSPIPQSAVAHHGSDALSIDLVQNADSFCVQENLASQEQHMSAYPNTGNFRVPKEAPTYTDYLEVMGEALRRVASRTPGGIKGVASAANCNERTLENIAQKRNGPNGFTLYQLQRMVPGFETEVKRLSGDDIDQEREVTEFVTRQIRKAARTAQ